MDYLHHLSKDKKLAAILTGQVHQLRFHQNIPLRLIASIMSQQLNTKVAEIIYKRFLQLFDGGEPTPGQVLATSYEQLRSIGLSHAKATYVHNVASFCVDNQVSDTMLLAMDNDAVISYLTQIKGVGRWTVEMLLMFTLGRPDVFPLDDLGIQHAMIKLYNIKAENKKELREKMTKLATRWSPYRTYACIHLWGWKDGE